MVREGGVEAGDVRLHRRQQSPGERPGLPEQLNLRGEQRLSLSARHEGLAAQRQLHGADPRNVECGRARRTAQELDQQAPILRRHPAGAESDVGRGLARDVWHIPAISLDDDTGAWTLDAHGLALDPERGVLEALPQVGGLDPIEQRREALVELRLVVRVPVEDEASVLPGRQDVQRCGRVILGRRRGRGTHADGEKQP